MMKASDVAMVSMIVCRVSPVPVRGRREKDGDPAWWAPSSTEPAGSDAEEPRSASAQPPLDGLDEDGLVHDRLRDAVVEAFADVLLAVTRHGVRRERDDRG